jgi:hypothetical protein
MPITMNTQSPLKDGSRTKLMCISYTDEHSAHKDSLADLNLGAHHGVVGCNSARFKSFKEGDIILITAAHNSTRYFQFGKIQTRLDGCRLWANEGGKLWDHNYTYTPLTTITILTPGLKQIRDEMCGRHNLNANYLMNSRFCSDKFLPMVSEFIAYLAKA